MNDLQKLAKVLDRAATLVQAAEINARTDLELALSAALRELASNPAALAEAATDCGLADATQLTAGVLFVADLLDNDFTY